MISKDGNRSFAAALHRLSSAANGDRDMRIGIAGIGNMGSSIGARLIEVGHTLTVWNRTADKTKSLAGAGAAVVKTPAELTSAVEIVITILTNADAIEAVYAGPQGLL